MISKVTTATVIGLEAYKIEVETDIVNSLPGVSIVGLPDASVNESRERVRSAIKNSGYFFPNQKVVINLAPAEIKKEGAIFDLSMAVGILTRDKIISQEKITEYAFLGELSLDGNLRGIKGVFPLVLGLKQAGVKAVIVPFENVEEAALANDIEVYGAKSLIDVVNHFSDTKSLKRTTVNVEEYLKINSLEEIVYDFKDVKGQVKVKKALEIAAAGGHNLLMSGSPGSGKTLMAKCFASILPPLELEESLELTKIYSIAGLLSDGGLVTKRPFRTVHHSASATGIIGGGSNPKPGEITLAHNGVLFLDEMVEFPRHVLENLRQPLEDGEVTISRVNHTVKYPADFILIGAMNPCPCGFLGDSQENCTCSEYQIQKYRAKLSGPLLDRIDIQIEVSRLSPQELLSVDVEAESSFTIRKRVVKARKVQAERYKSYGFYTNSQLSSKLIKEFCKIDKDSENFLKMAVVKFKLSGRAYDRVLKLSRTIADLDGSENIKQIHIAQALQYKGSMFETVSV